MRLKWTQAARKHKIGRAHVVFVLATAVPESAVTRQGNPAWLYVGPDERGIELEVIGVELADRTLLITHVMPTALRRN